MQDHNIQHHAALEDEELSSLAAPIHALSTELQIGRAHV